MGSKQNSYYKDVQTYWSEINLKAIIIPVCLHLTWIDWFCLLKLNKSEDNLSVMTICRHLFDIRLQSRLYGVRSITVNCSLILTFTFVTLFVKNVCNVGPNGVWCVYISIHHFKHFSSIERTYKLKENFR